MFSLLVSVFVDLAVALSFHLDVRYVWYALEEVCGRVEGRQEAERDIAAGTMKLKIYGYRAGLDWGHDAYVRRMRKRLDVEVVVVAQCTLTSWEHGLWDGYNQRIREELERRHGSEILSQVREEATAQWQRRLALVTTLPVLV